MSAQADTRAVAAAGNEARAPAASPASFDGGARYGVLDAVRGIAILLVLGHHASFRFPFLQGDPVAGFFRSVGWIGVDVFFALSGFLIVRILQRDADRGDIRGFFRRRFFRIVPIFVVAVATYGLASLATGHEPENLHRLWMPALLLNGWLIPLYGEAVPFTITWSLSVEEFAYLALGLAAWVAPANVRRMVWAFLAIAVVVRVAVLVTGAFPSGLLYFFVPARLDAIAFGGLGAFGAYDAIVRRTHATRLAGLGTFALMVGFQWTSVNGWFLPAIGYPLFGLLAAIWVTGLARAPVPPRSIVTRTLAAVGRLSYFIYLFHLFFIEAVRALGHMVPGGGLSYWPAVVLAAVACYAAAAVSWRIFEAPLIRRAHRATPVA